jgi:hypothetical protein
MHIKERLTFATRVMMVLAQVWCNILKHAVASNCCLRDVSTQFKVWNGHRLQLLYATILSKMLKAEVCVFKVANYSIKEQYDA